MATRKRRTKRERSRYLPIAERIGQVAGELLEDEFDNAPWIHQVVEIVKGGVDRGVKQLSAGTALTSATFKDGATYTHPPKTRDQLTQEMLERTGASSIEEAFEKENSGEHRQRKNGGSMPWV